MWPKANLQIGLKTYLEIQLNSQLKMLLQISDMKEWTKTNLRIKSRIWLSYISNNIVKNQPGYMAQNIIGINAEL